MEVLVKESAGLPGVIFNTGDLSEPSNLRLQAAARQVWTDPNTSIITCMPFFVSKRMELIQDLWDYNHSLGRVVLTCTHSTILLLVQVVIYMLLSQPGPLDEAKP